MRRRMSFICIPWIEEYGAPSQTTECCCPDESSGGFRHRDNDFIATLHQRTDQRSDFIRSDTPCDTDQQVTRI